MGIRWTEEEAKEAGFRKDADGNWYGGPQRKQKQRKKETEAYPQTGNRHAMLEHQRSLPRKSYESASQKKKSKEGSAESNQSSASRNRSVTTGSPSPRRFKILVIAYCLRHTDPDNLLPKYYIDEIVKAGYIPDDSSKYIDSIEKRVVKIEKGEQTRTVIKIWKM